VVDAAVQLIARGHRVVLFTAHHDAQRCFDETRDGTLDVRVHGALLPGRIGRRLRAPTAIARMSFCAAALARSGPYDAIFCDGVAQVIPLLRLLARAPVLFYCHFPDLLLTPLRGRMYRWYRLPLDRWEEWGMERAGRVLVNSEYTAAAFARVFPGLRGAAPTVLHPGVDAAAYRRAADSLPADSWRTTLLSLARYEPAKNSGLAVEAFARLRAELPPERFAALRLVVAGGYDERLAENRDTLRALEWSARRLGVDAQVSFLTSIAERQRLELLASCLCLIHTPPAEHFGLVPLEAMACGRPVVAVDRGGPRETVVDGETGFLRSADAGSFAAALAELITDPARADRMGRAGAARAEKHFSSAVFGSRLDAILREMVGGG
jgi:alpha-1,3/alpha-1,6-mannosyltransferase